jgi:ParB-like chromosome segregation protein Spo0J
MRSGQTPPRRNPPAPAGLRVARVPIGSVKPDPANAREHNPRNLGAIGESLKAFGQQKPIVVDRAGVVVAGNGTLAAARALGWTEIDVAVTDLEGPAARAFALADNRIGELSMFDEGRLASALAGVPASLLDATGFDAGDLAELADAVAPAEASEAGARASSASAGERAVLVKVVLAVRAAELFERAMQATGLMNREDALAAICEAYIKGKS